MNVRNRITSNYVRASHPTAFSGLTNIRRYYRGDIERVNIPKLLGTVYSYGLHREYKKPRVRNPFYIKYLRQQMQVDLIDMQENSEVNDNYKFLFCIIDCFSKKAWVKPMKSKDADTSLKIFKELYSQINPKARSYFMDRGGEFKNKKVYAFLKREKVNIIHPNSEIKAAIVERFNRSLQRIIYTDCTERQSHRYIDRIELYLQTYNNRSHRSIANLTPNQGELPENRVTVENAFKKRFNEIQNKAANMKSTYEIGDTVRIKTEKTKFSRGYHEQFSREYFRIVEVNIHMPIPTYTVKSLDTEEIISGSFYKEELQRVEEGVYKLTVLKERTLKGKKQYYVKWLGFGDQHNTWINSSDISDDYRV